VVVALSGLDGSGKSTQAEALRDHLEGAGIATAVAWTKLGGTTWAATVSGRVKDLLGLSRPVSSTPPRTYASGARDDVVDTGTLLRRRSRALTWAWTLLLVVDNIRAHRRVVRQDAAVVVCDRYVLDSVAQLRHRYGDRPYRLHTLLLRRLSPVPASAWFLDVPPAVARARKPEQFGLAELESLAACYRSASAALGVPRVDGEAPAEALTAALVGEAKDVLAVLSSTAP
jgi:thymidylate kinase